MTSTSPFVDRRIVILVVLVAAAALSWWWSQNGEMPHMGVVPTGGNESDYSFKGLTVSDMGPGGDLVHTLAADELDHYPAQESSLLTEPRMAFYEAGNKTWDIAAHSGVAMESDRSVLLNGDVRVDYAGSVPGQGFVLYTEQLRVWPDDRRAETDQAVRIVQASGVIDSVGLKAELDTSRLFLLSQVRGTYEP